MVILFSLLMPMARSGHALGLDHGIFIAMIEDGVASVHPVDHHIQGPSGHALGLDHGVFVAMIED
ncbi:hypothetical protein [Aeromonas hydrophila]|uniref:hypothetical protein n=1 Tax=Aeromonas hydrophila TaxID=644 RepID=UPI0030D7F14F